MGLKYPRTGTAIYRTEQWKAVRFQAKRRDGWKCVQCGARGRLEADHIVPLRKGGAAFDLDNLQSLCGGCHARKTRLEVGLGDIDPARAAWRSFVKELQNA